jgi:hypothetical protein
LSKNQKTGATGGIRKLDISKLKVSNTGGEAEDNVLEDLTVGTNDLKQVILSRCINLQRLYIQKNPNLDQLEGLDNLKKLQVLNKDGDMKISPIHSDTLDYYKALAELVREMAGIDSKDPLPKNKNELKDKIKAGVNSPLKNEKDAAKQEAKDAKVKLTTAETERDQLKQRLEAINKELGLKNDATDQQTLVKIKELMGRPTTPCTHTDYDSIKSERDSLKTEVESKKRKISELEDAKKENKENVITKKILVDTTDTN